MADPVLVKAFVQVNTVKGWRYLDDAGRMMNHFADQFPEMKVGLNGLQLRAPDATLDDARVTAQDIWVSFTRPATTQLIGDQAWNFVRAVAEFLDVTSASRLGLRMQYLLPVAPTTDLVTRVASVVLGAAVLDLARERHSFGVEMQFSIDAAHMATLRVEPVQVVDRATLTSSIPGEGLMFDGDVSRTGSFAITEARQFLRTASAWCDEHLLALAARVAEEASV